VWGKGERSGKRTSLQTLQPVPNEKVNDPVSGEKTGVKSEHTRPGFVNKKGTIRGNNGGEPKGRNQKRNSNIHRRLLGDGKRDTRKDYHSK